MAPSYDAFKTYFQIYTTNEERYQRRYAKVQSKLNEVGKESREWRAQDQKDLRWQLYLDREQSLQQDLLKMNSLQTADGYEQLGDLKGKVDTLLEEMRTEREINWRDSTVAFKATLIKCNLIEGRPPTSEWIKIGRFVLKVYGVIPTELADGERNGTKEYMDVRDAAMEKAKTYRKIAAAKLNAAELQIQEIWSVVAPGDLGASDIEVSREAASQIHVIVEKLNDDLDAIIKEASEKAMLAAVEEIKKLILLKDSRADWKFRMGKKATFGVVTLGLSIVSLVASAGADGFAWYSSAKNLMALGSLFSDAWKGVVEVHRELEAMVQDLESNLLQFQKKLQSASDPSTGEVYAVILKTIGLPSGLIGMMLSTVSEAHWLLLMLRAKLEGINESINQLLVVIYQAMDDVTSLRKSGSVDGSKIKELESVINNSLALIGDLQAQAEGKRDDADRLEAGLLKYEKSLDGFYSEPEKSWSSMDMLTVLSSLSAIDVKLGGSITSSTSTAVQNTLISVCSSARDLVVAKEPASL